MNYRHTFLALVIYGLVPLSVASCSSTKASLSNPEESSSEAEALAVSSDNSSIPVNPSYFLTENLTKEITQEPCTLSDGSQTSCYSITIKPAPQEHDLGPWCPTNVTDGKDKGGIWFKDGNVYDVDGNFIASLADFYGDAEWNLVNEDGSIRVTDTQEAFEAAARPDVDPRYNNYCVEGRPEWLDIEEVTYKIPIKPTYQETPASLGQGGGIGVAFNGVPFDPPAPVNAILAAHTLAPLDDHGGHLNPFEGYHYHAATGYTKEIAQSDNHAPMIGYALDGFGIFALLDKEQKEPVGLDESGGHSDAVRGYHYHAGKPGDNQIIKSFRGLLPKSDKPSGPEGGGPGNEPGGGPGGGPGAGGRPNFAEAANKLGVTEQALEQAMQAAGGPQADLAEVAKQLNVSEADLREALPPPPN